MSRDAQQIARLLQQVLRMSKGKLSWKAILALCIGVVIYGVWLQPTLEKSFGISLPGIHLPNDSGGQASDGQASSGESGGGSDVATPKINPADLDGLLTKVGRDTYQSPTGLRYTRGSQHGHRLAHLMAHTRDEPNRVGQHGVFDSDDPATVVRLVDEAYEQAQSGRNVKTEHKDGRTAYTIDLGRRIGYIGGQSGNRRHKPSAEHLKLVVQGDRLITAFPVRPY